MGGAPLPHQRHGFTLLEILISLSVLVIGLVGILALFPVGFHSSKQSVQDSTTTMLAQSIQASLIASLDRTKPGQPVEYHHDGVPTGVTFLLPAAPGLAVEVPKDAQGPFKGEVFKVSQILTKDPNRLPGIDEDDRQYYGQYAFNITIRESTQPALDTLFEFIIQIYRNYDAGPREKNPVQTFNFLHWVKKK